MIRFECEGLRRIRLEISSGSSATWLTTKSHPRQLRSYSAKVWTCVGCSLNCGCMSRGDRLLVSAASAANRSEYHHEAVRKHGVAPEIGGWLRDRNELRGRSTDSPACTTWDSLGAVCIYVELRTRRRLTMSELAYLVDAANWSLGSKPTVSDPKNLERELRRLAQKQSSFC